MTQHHILIVGCGSIGGVIASKLMDAGHSITVITHNPKITKAIVTQGLEARCGGEKTLITHPTAYTSLEDAKEKLTPFTLCILATPPTASLDAAHAALPYLTSDACIVCCTNGLIEEHLASSHIDPERLIGSVVSFGAIRHAAGVVEQSAQGGFTLGRLEPRAHDPALDMIEKLLSCVGPVQRASNLRGARWSKLAINCAISSIGTIGGDRLGVLMRHRFVRRLALETMTEVVHIAHAEQVTLKKVAGTIDLDWLALSHKERRRQGSPGLLMRHTMLLAVGTKFRKMRSSMLAAMERGRTPHVDFLNGEITSRASKHNISTPINAAIQDTVHAIARGEQHSSLQTLRNLYDNTRAQMHPSRLN